MVKQKKILHIYLIIGCFMAVLFCGSLANAMDQHTILCETTQPSVNLVKSNESLVETSFYCIHCLQPYTERRTLTNTLIIHKLAESDEESDEDMKVKYFLASETITNQGLIIRGYLAENARLNNEIKSLKKNSHTTTNLSIEPLEVKTDIEDDSAFGSCLKLLKLAFYGFKEPEKKF